MNDNINESLNCSKHKNMETVKICNKFPCFKNNLCEECVLDHYSSHNTQDLNLWRLYLNKTIKAQIKTNEISDFLNSQNLKCNDPEHQISYASVISKLSNLKKQIKQQREFLEILNKNLKEDVWDGSHADIKSQIILLNLENDKIFVEITELVYKLPFVYVCSGDLKQNTFFPQLKSTHILPLVVGLNNFDFLIYDLDSKAVIKSKNGMTKRLFPEGGQLIFTKTTTLKVDKHLFIIAPQLKPFYSSDWLLEINLEEPPYKAFEVNDMNSQKNTCPSVSMGKNKYIYTIGGTNWDKPTEKCERYDIKKGNWIRLMPLQNEY